VKVISLAEAVEFVPDGGSIGTGGILMTRKPVALLDAVGRARRELTLWTLLGSVDAELLTLHGALAQSNTIYVGFEQLGFAPAYSQALADGTVEAREYSELLMLCGLRASLAGLPFLPTRGAQGSDVATALGIREIICPYTGETLFAAPAIRPDVALIHAGAADAYGNVQGPAHRDFLFDWDANIARASTRVVVSVERIVDEVEDALLFAHEVDAVVVAPRGAHPTALPGAYAADLQRVGAYLRGEQALL
jgi:glutaconate CoA-transferase subunit A